MFKRLTVQQIEKIKSPLLAKELDIQNAYFTKEHIFIIRESQPEYLQKITYNDFQIIESIKLPQNIQKGKIRSLIQVEDIIIFAVDGKNDLYFINSERQTFSLSSHLQPINQVIYFALEKQIITCSDDLTVRVWEFQKGKLIPSKSKHIYSGHQEKVSIVCSFNSHNLFVSVSKDNTLIFWKNSHIQYSIKLYEVVKSLLYCQKSNQCLIFCQNSEVYGVQLNQILKDPKKVQLHKIINKELEQIKKYEPRNCREIDDSFVMFLDNKSLVFLQKNIGQIIKRIQISEKEQEIFEMFQVLRMVIFANRKGIYLLRF